MAIDYAADAIEKQVLTDEELKSISELVQLQLALEASIESMEDQIDSLKKKLRQVSEHELPEKLGLFNLSELKTVDGDKIIVKSFYNASISPENRDSAFRYLRRHGFGDIIKHEIAAQFGSGEDKMSKRLRAYMLRYKFNFKDEEKVNTGTLKALVKEQLQGTELQGDSREKFKELFKVYEGKKTIIKQGGK